MAKFFVGQRVRKISSDVPYPLVSIGAEGVIERFGIRPKGTVLPSGKILSQDNDVWVRYGDKVYSEVCAHIEPILYDGAQPSEFSYSELMDNLRTKVQEEV